MRGLILTGILGMALPAFGAGDPAPVMGATAPEEVMPTPEPIRGEVVPAVEPASVEAVEAAEAVPAVSPSAVARATFATAIDQREPVDSISSLGSDRDRVYLPAVELERFGCTAEQLFRREVTPAFRDLMRFQVERARQYFRDAAALYLFIAADQHIRDLL